MVCFRVFMAIVFGAMATGQASSFAPNYKKARIAANKLFYLLDRHTEIDSSSTEGDQPVSPTHHNYNRYLDTPCSFHMKLTLNHSIYQETEYRNHLLIGKLTIM